MSESYPTLGYTHLRGIVEMVSPPIGKLMDQIVELECATTCEMAGMDGKGYPARAEEGEIQMQFWVDRFLSDPELNVDCEYVRKRPALGFYAAIADLLRKNWDTMRWGPISPQIW